MLLNKVLEYMVQGADERISRKGSNLSVEKEHAQIERCKPALLCPDCIFNPQVIR
jgi:hypothetical protein